MSFDKDGNDLGGRPPIWETPDQLQAGIDLYFEVEAKVLVGYEDGEPIYALQPTMSGLALSLGVDRKTITNYANKDEFFPAIKKARNMVENALERHLYGKNVTGAIFNLKNNFGWVDKREVDNKSSDGSMTPKAIERVVVDPKPE
jgi:hypothetical protein